MKKNNFLFNLSNKQKEIIKENKFKDKIIKNNINIKLSKEDTKEDIIKKFKKLKEEYNKLNELQEILQLKNLCLKKALINDEEYINNDTYILDILKEKFYYNIDKPLTKEDIDYFFKNIYYKCCEYEYDSFIDDINDILDNDNFDENDFYKKIEKRIKKNFKNKCLSKDSENYIKEKLLHYNYNGEDDEIGLYNYFIDYQ